MQKNYFLLSFTLHMCALSSLVFLSTPQTHLETKSIDIQIVNNIPAKKVRYVTTKFSITAKPTKNILFEKKSAYELLQKQDLNRSEFSKNTTEWQDKNSYSTNEFTDFENIEMVDISYLKSLWIQIDNAVVENPYLSEYGHTGKVYFQFEISQQGQLLQESLKATAEDNILKVIAARAIRQALNDDNNDRPKPKKRIKVQAQFSWAGYEACKKFKGIHQKNLSFCKYAEDKRKTFSGTEKAGSYLGALSYGFGAIEEIQKYNQQEYRNKTNFDPFEQFRRDPDWSLGS